MKSKLLFWLLITVLLVTAPPAEAQQPAKIPRIAFLGAASLSANSARIDAFRQGLRELGYVEGKNIVVEYRYADGKPDRLPALGAELVGLKVDVIVSGGAAATRPAKEATATIPVIMTGDNDPVRSGFVAEAVRETELAAGALRVQLQYLDVLGPKDIATGLRKASKGGADGVLVLGGPVFVLQRKQIAALAVESRGRTYELCDEPY